MGIFNLMKKRRPLEEKEDFEKDLFSVMEFLATVGRDIKDIHELGLKVKKSRRTERSETDTKKQVKLLEQEIEAWDKFLERYVMFQRDVGVTGARIKKISEMLKQEASQIDVSPETKALVKKKDEWNFNW